VNPQLAVETIQQTLLTALWVALPLLITLFVVGVVISLLQIVTSIQDPSFGAVPRLATFFVVLFLALPWILMRLTTFTARLFSSFDRYAH
jgi:flagellar biosynthesis protein FliQ